MAFNRRGWNPAKEIPKLQKWLVNHRELVFERNLGNVRGDLQSPIIDWISILVRFGPLAAWHGKVGLIEVHTSGSWNEIAGSCEYHYWIERIRGSFPRRAAPRPIPMNLALVLAHGLAAGFKARANWAGGVLLQSTADPSVLFSSWDHFPIIGFMARLFAIYSGKCIDCSKQPMATTPAYEAILQAWDEGGQQLEAAIVSACDYHQNQTDPNNDFHQFGSAPYVAYAPEILAIYAVRKELGLETPQVDHPLLQSPLAKSPDPFPEYHDELLDAVAARYHEQFGSDV